MDAPARLARHLPALRAAADPMEAAFYFNNALFLLSRVALSPEFEVEPFGTSLLVRDGDRWASVLPLSTDRAAYVGDVRRALQPGRDLLRIPGWVIPEMPDQIFFQHWPDWVGLTEGLQSLAARKHKSVRRRVEQALRAGRVRVAPLGGEHEAEAADVARAWYLARASKYETLWLEAENVWLFENLGWLAHHVPGFVATGVWVDDVLCAANLVCDLSATVACAHTERYRPHVLQGINALAYREGCRRLDAGTTPWINDGSSDAEPVRGHDDLASYKARLTDRLIVPFGISGQPVVTATIEPEPTTG